jgi:hypothetical protein
MTKQQIEVEPVYETAVLVSQDLVSRIRELLYDLPAPDGETSINWAHVGDVNHVNYLLSKVVAKLEGTA